jgi:hypothetical protein
LALLFQIVVGIGVSGYQEVIIRVSGYQGDPSWFPGFLMSCILIHWSADLHSPLSTIPA